MPLIEKLIKSQKEWQINNDDINFEKVYGVQKKELFTDNKETYEPKKNIPIRKHLIILDDCLCSEEVWAGYAGKLALLSTFSRHAEIIIIWVSQVWNRLPTTVRQMLDCIVYFYMNPIPESFIKEIFNKEEQEFFYHFIKHNFGWGKQYSFMIIDTNGSNNDEMKMYQDGQTGKRFFLTT